MLKRSIASIVAVLGLSACGTHGQTTSRAHAGSDHACPSGQYWNGTGCTYSSMSATTSTSTTSPAHSGTAAGNAPASSSRNSARSTSGIQASSTTNASPGGEKQTSPTASQNPSPSAGSQSSPTPDDIAKAEQALPLCRKEQPGIPLQELEREAANPIGIQC
jgi:hypothetical protein